VQVLDGGLTDPQRTHGWLDVGVEHVVVVLFGSDRCVLVGLDSGQPRFAYVRQPGIAIDLCAGPTLPLAQCGLEIVLGGGVGLTLPTNQARYPVVVAEPAPASNC